jgi:hypothetical protein
MIVKVNDVSLKLEVLAEEARFAPEQGYDCNF